MPTTREVVVEVGGITIVSSTRTIQVLETGHAPVYYVPLEDVASGVLRPASGTTFCEWKGSAHYYDVIVNGERRRRAAWTYRQPNPAYASIVGYVAFYAQAVDRCTVDDEVVTPNDGDFYGGWITGHVAGPFKGAPGTRWW